jgi:hypothetical protein
MTDGGHVFVVQGDLLQIHADDLLVPCDDELNVTTVWKPVLGPTQPGSWPWIRPVGISAPGDFNDSSRPPVRLADLGDGRRVWLVNSGGQPTDVDWLIAGIRNAIAAATDSSRQARHQRARQLIAMPVFGVGSGGFDGQHGSVLDRMLAELEQAVAAPGAPDVALVLYARADYAAVQARRRERSEIPERIQHLGKLVRESGLVLFIGSGASAGAGFPTWKDLLAELAERAQLSEDVRLAALKLPAPDAADVIGSGLEDLQAAIAEIFTQDGCSLTHALLASLRVREAVTTNYDTLYENAAVIPHVNRLKVLPRERRAAEEPWLLKLHGDIKLDKSIVLTREQYVRFDSDSMPLASVVQSLMVTKHMLFIGYSLSDENFIRLARQVRQMFRAAGTTGQVGTVLALFGNPARDRLWQEDLEFIPMSPVVAGEEPDDAGAARQLEIFLDQLAIASCDDAPYVLNERYLELVSEDDRRLAKALRPLIAAAARRGSAPETSAWTRAQALLRDLGWEA